MEIKNLETFCMVAELKSFTRAAEKLGFTQSTVSFQIKQLERELGAPLFERVNHKISLTNEGTRLLPLAHSIIRLSAEASHVAGDTTELGGVVRIGIAESLAAWQIRTKFAALHRAFPQIQLKIVYTSTVETLRLLGQNEVDFAYILDRAVHENRYEVIFDRAVPMHFAAKRGHPLTGRRGVSLAEIAAYPLLLTEKDMSYRALLDEAAARQNLELRPIIEVGDTQIICSLLEQGVGVSYLPDFVLREGVENGKLAILDAAPLDFTVHRQILYLRSKWISPEMQCVLNALQKD